jgi:hypothetical protein
VEVTQNYIHLMDELPSLADAYQSRMSLKCVTSGEQTEVDIAESHLFRDGFADILCPACGLHHHFALRSIPETNQQD